MKLINRARKAVAIAMAVFGVGFVICVRRDDYLTHTLKQDSGIWSWGGRAFGIGVLVYLALTLVLIVEHVARPPQAKHFSLRSLFVRWLLTVIVVVAIGVWMAVAYGAWQTIGAVTGTFFLLAAVRERDMPRATLGGLAVIVFGLTVSGTQTSYQYARRHADEIVAAACELAAQCPRSEYRAYRLRRNLVGTDVDSGDPRVPQVLRKLGAQRIWIDDERVAVYVGGDTEFQIDRTSHPAGRNPVWAPHWKGSTSFTDRLSTNVY